MLTVFTVCAAAADWTWSVGCETAANGTTGTRVGVRVVWRGKAPRRDPSRHPNRSPRHRCQCDCCEPIVRASTSTFLQHRSGEQPTTTHLSLATGAMTVITPCQVNSVHSYRTRRLVRGRRLPLAPGNVAVVRRKNPCVNSSRRPECSRIPGRQPPTRTESAARSGFSKVCAVRAVDYLTEPCVCRMIPSMSRTCLLISTDREIRSQYV